MGVLTVQNQERTSAGVRNEEAECFPNGGQWPEIDKIYAQHKTKREVYDILTGDRYRTGIRDLIDFVPRSPEYILSIPHAGVFVPEPLCDHFRLGNNALMEIDLYSDLCYEMAEGMHVRSELAPFVVDMNRTRDGTEKAELPRHLTNAAHEYYDVKDRLMLRRPYSAEEKEQVLAYYDVYHGILNALIERMRQERGYALVFDCHSMTSVGLGRAEDEGKKRANFVIGTLNGTSAHGGIIDAFTSNLRGEIAAQDLGLTIARDVPYSGGLITRLHHKRDAHIHVLQLEITMDTYMCEVTESAPTRYALKRPRLRFVRSAVRSGFRAAAEEAERIHHHTAGA